MPSQPMPVSTLAVLIRLAERVLRELGDGTAVMVGRQYLVEPGPGSAPRIVFVPEDRGRLDGALKVSAGYLASWSHVCQVSVRGAEPGDDSGRLEPAYQLADRVIQILKGLDPAHVVLAPGGPRDTSPQDVDGAPGVDVTFAFTYTRSVAQDPAVLKAIRKIQSVSPPDPDRPLGDTGQTFTVGAAAASAP